MCITGDAVEVVSVTVVAVSVTVTVTFRWLPLRDLNGQFQRTPQYFPFLT